jgi:hypothetical protein
MNQPLAALALAAAMLLGSGRPGSGRLRGMIAGPVAGDDARGYHGRAREMVLGGLAVGLLAWAIHRLAAGGRGRGRRRMRPTGGAPPARQTSGARDDAVELASAWPGWRSASKRACRWRRRWLPRESLDGSTGVALRRVASELASLRQLADLEGRMKEVSSLAGDRVKRYRDYLWFDLVRVRADNAFLKAQIRELQETLGADPLHP